METTTGLILAFVALFCWGFGDFFIQRATRLVGSWRALFYIGITGTIGLFPFIAAELPHLTTDNLLLLGLVAAIVLGGALFDFEALRQGKIAIIEPTIGLELPLTVALSMVLAGETLTTAQILLIVLTFIGLTLAISAHKPNFRSRKTMLEKGVILALVGAIAMALNNLVIGISSQNISPLLTIWFGHTGAALACLIYLAARKQHPRSLTDSAATPAPSSPRAYWITSPGSLLPRPPPLFPSLLSPPSAKVISPLPSCWESSSTKKNCTTIKLAEPRWPLSASSHYPRFQPRAQSQNTPRAWPAVRAQHRRQHLRPTPAEPSPHPPAPPRDTISLTMAVFYFIILALREFLLVFARQKAKL